MLLSLSVPWVLQHDAVSAPDPESAGSCLLHNLERSLPSRLKAFGFGDDLFHDSVSHFQLALLNVLVEVVGDPVLICSIAERGVISVFFD